MYELTLTLTLTDIEAFQCQCTSKTSFPIPHFSNIHVKVLFCSCMAKVCKRNVNLISKCWLVDKSFAHLLIRCNNLHSPKSIDLFCNYFILNYFITRLVHVILIAMNLMTPCWRDLDCLTRNPLIVERRIFWESHRQRGKRNYSSSPRSPNGELVLG